MSSVPVHLSPEVAEVWVELAPTSPRRGPDFEAYCAQVARVRDAQRRISSDGLVVADAKGVPVPHPALEIERKAQAELRAWGGQFVKRGRAGGS